MWTAPASGNYKLRAEHGRPSGHCGESSSFITARACDPLASAGDRPLFEWRGSSTCRSKVGRIFPLQRRGHTMRCAVLHPLRRTIGRQNKIYCPSTTTKACPLFICLLAAATNFCSGIRRLFCHRRGWDREVLFFVGPLTLTPVGENGPTDSDSFLILSVPRFKRIRTASQSVHFIFFFHLQVSVCLCVSVCSCGGRH